MKVPFADLSGSFDYIYDEILDKIEYLIKNTRFIGGEEVESFENEFAQYCNTRYAVGCSNGTSALILSLKALGIHSGDTVITAPNTFIATTEAITAVGANIKFVDIEEAYYTIDPELLDDYLSRNKEKENIKAIIVIHLFGQMANIIDIKKIADKYDVKIIEDSAQCHGSSLNGIKPGQYGDVATFSFYPGKNLGAFGDAGAVVTNSHELSKKIKMLSNHGRWNKKYEHELEGFNGRLDSIQAAVLRIKLRYLDKWNNMRIANADKYNKLIRNSSVILPQVRKNSKHVYHIYAIRHPQRELLIQHLKSENIGTGIHYPIPLHLQPAYKHLGYKRGDFPITEKVADQLISLPMWPEMEKEQIEYVAKTINKFSL